MLPCGQIVGMINDLPSIKEIVDSIISEVSGVEQRLHSTLSRS